MRARSTLDWSQSKIFLVCKCFGMLIILLWLHSLMNSKIRVNTCASDALFNAVYQKCYRQYHPK